MCLYSHSWSSPWSTARTSFHRPTAVKTAVVRTKTKVKNKKRITFIVLDRLGSLQDYRALTAFTDVWLDLPHYRTYGTRYESPRPRKNPIFKLSLWPVYNVVLFRRMRVTRQPGGQIFFLLRIEFHRIYFSFSKTFIWNFADFDLGKIFFDGIHAWILANNFIPNTSNKLYSNTVFGTIQNNSTYFWSTWKKKDCSTKIWHV